MAGPMLSAATDQEIEVPLTEKKGQAEDLIG